MKIEPSVSTTEVFASLSYLCHIQLSLSLSSCTKLYMTMLIIFSAYLIEAPSVKISQSMTSNVMVLFL